MHIELSRALIGLFLMVAGWADTTGTAIPKVAAADSHYDSSETAKPEVLRLEITVTAYSSSIDETDDDPFTTASGKTVYDGIVATNLLPFGTKLRIPEEFGDRVFVVEDRMNRRYQDRIDIWMPSKHEAKQFGKKNLEVEILPEDFES